MSGDWHDAVSTPNNRTEELNEGGNSHSLRGEQCMTQVRQTEMRDVLAKRRTNTPPDRKVRAQKLNSTVVS